LIGLAFVSVAAVWLAYRSTSEWDYPLDAGPAIDALAHGRFHEFLSARPAMGPFSMIVRAPFAALGQLAGNGGREHIYLDDYRFGVFPCVFAAGIFGLVLARMMEQLGRPPVARAAVVVVATVNPVSLRAIHYGHPEEILGAVLLAGSALAALRGRPWLAAVLVALAITNKQWAIIGLPTILLTVYLRSGAKGVRGPALGLAGVIALLVVPLLIVDAHTLVDATRRLANLKGSYVFPASIWYPFAPELPPERAQHVVSGLLMMPSWLAVLARPLIVAMGVALPLLFARRVAGDLQQRALPLLALVMLLRCALDPADNGYYHVPFLMAVLAADAFSGRFYATAAACIFLQIPTTFPASPAVLNAYYLCWALPFAVYLAGRAWGVDWVALLRSRGVRGRAAARTLRPS
jgi:hypothetical protein